MVAQLESQVAQAKGRQHLFSCHAYSDYKKIQVKMIQFNMFANLDCWGKCGLI